MAHRFSFPSIGAWLIGFAAIAFFLPACSDSQIEVPSEQSSNTPSNNESNENNGLNNDENNDLNNWEDDFNNWEDDFNNDNLNNGGQNNSGGPTDLCGTIYCTIGCDFDDEGCESECMEAATDEARATIATIEACWATCTELADDDDDAFWECLDDTCPEEDAAYDACLDEEDASSMGCAAHLSCVQECEVEFETCLAACNAEGECEDECDYDLLECSESVCYVMDENSEDILYDLLICEIEDCEDDEDQQQCREQTCATEYQACLDDA